MVAGLLKAADYHLRAFPFPATIADPEQEDCPLVRANDHFYKLTLYQPHEIIGRNCRLLQRDRKIGNSKIGKIIKDR